MARWGLMPFFTNDLNGRSLRANHPSPVHEDGSLHLAGEQYASHLRVLRPETKEEVEHRAADVHEARVRTGNLTQQTAMRPHEQAKHKFMLQGLSDERDLGWVIE